MYSSIRRLWQIAIVFAIVSIGIGIYSAKPWAASTANNILAIGGLAVILFNLFRPGVRFVLYTDGLVEALNPAGEIFGWDRFKSFIKSNGGLDAGQFSDRLLDDISRWSGRPSKGSLDDDLTLMVVDFENAAT